MWLGATPRTLPLLPLNKWFHALDCPCFLNPPPSTLPQMKMCSCATSKIIFKKLPKSSKIISKNLPKSSKIIFKKLPNPSKTISKNLPKSYFRSCQNPPKSSVGSCLILFDLVLQAQSLYPGEDPEFFTSGRGQVP